MWIFWCILVVIVVSCIIYEVRRDNIAYLNRERKRIYDEIKAQMSMSCFVCGADSNDKHLCRECYFKYKDHDVLLKLHAGCKVTVTPRSAYILRLNSFSFTYCSPEYPKNST